MSILSRLNPWALRHLPLRCFNGRSSSTTANTLIDVSALLSKPHPSPSQLTQPPSAPEELITPAQLHHLLRLSALPPPSTPQEESELLATLTAQLSFVRQIQAVDTRGVEPLRSLRDESTAGREEAEAVMERELQEALSKEEIRGKHHRRIRRKDVAHEKVEEEGQWKVLETAQRKVGRFFVVEGGGKAGGQGKG